MKTYVTKPDDVERKWYVVDAEDQVLGRLAGQVASVLRGKHKAMYQPNIDTGDYVIVVNADKIALSAQKELKKQFFVARKHIGNSKNYAFKDLMNNHPERVIEKAVWGMLPKNALGRKMFRKLRVYKGPNHTHVAQKPEPMSI